MAKVFESCTEDDNVFAHRAESDRVKIQKHIMHKVEHAAHSGEFKIRPSHLKAYNMFFSGKSYAEIAEELKVTPQVAKNYKCIAQRKKKEFVEALK